MKKILAIYSVLVGAAMIAMWSVLYALYGLPGLLGPREIAVHLTAEFATAGLLILSGFGLLSRAPWANRASLLAGGMLIYTLFQNAGDGMQRNAGAFAAMFIVCFAATLILSPVFKPQRS